jgi:hypothetical protein
MDRTPRRRQGSLIRIIGLALALAAVATTTLSAPAAGRPAVSAAALPPLPPPSSTRYGLVTNSDLEYSVQAAARVGAKVMRIEVGPQSAPAAYDALFAQAAAAGMRLQPMFGFDAAPTATTAGAWAARFGPGGTFWASHAGGALAPVVFEWGNENSYTYAPKPGPAGGAAYARSFKMAYDAIKAPNANPAVGLLCQADDGGTGSTQWLNGMYSAVPGLHAYVAGWVVHIFGPGGPDKVGRMITQTAAKGAPTTVPIAVTEDGIATDDGHKLKDNYGYPANLTYAKAAEILSSKLRDVQTRYGSRISMYLIYQSHDNRPPGATKNKEDYFGAVRQDLSDKGNWSAYLRALFTWSAQ